MAQIRNKTADELQVPELGRVVAPDEVVDVDDELFESRVWPESVWAVVKGTKTRPKGKAAADPEIGADETAP